MKSCEHTEVKIGEASWSWTHNGHYTRVYDEEGDEVFAVNGTRPTQELVIAAIYGYKAGFSNGKKVGISFQQNETKRVLGLLL